MTEKYSAAIIAVSGLELSDEEKYLLHKYHPLGVTLFGRNIKDKEQIKKLTTQIREACEDSQMIIAVDQEGGRVRRLAEPEFLSYASQYVLGKISEKADPEAAHQAIIDHARLISHDLHDCGINLNYAPVLDLAFENTTPVIKSRCFGSNEKQVADYGKIMINEYIKNGICPCIKHMPGHGRAEVDPHLGLPILDYSLKELQKDFYPFQEVQNAPAGMTAHVIIPEIDANHPISQSSKGIKEIIRGLIGFDGLLISDAIDMKALHGSLGEKAKNCIKAGCDVICCCGSTPAELTEICDNVGLLADKSMIRFEKIKNLFHNNNKFFNLDSTAREYEALTGRIEKYQDDYDATEVLNKMKHN